MNNEAMEEIYEKRRLVMKELIDSIGHGAIAQIAKEIEVEPNYLSRCLYPPGKPGRKNIGDEIVMRMLRKRMKWGLRLLAISDASLDLGALSQEAIEAAGIVSSFPIDEQVELLHWLRTEEVRRLHAREKS